MSQHDDGLWMIMAVIQEFRLDAVTLALEQVPEFAGLTVSDCRGFGQGKMRGGDKSSGTSIGSDQSSEIADFAPKVKLEVAVTTRENAEAVADTIVRAAHTGRPGDGKVFAWPLSHAIRIRTMQLDRAAIDP